MKKFIMGWLKLRPGTRDAFIQRSASYIDVCRKEPGCVFFDFSLSPFDPDVAMVMECFASGEAHDLHLTQPHFKKFWQELSEVCVEGTFENIFADHVVPDTARFGDAL